MIKHTPGPWDWRNIDALWTRDDGRYGESVLCASYDYDRGAHLKTTDANRNLIAAAPDLLEAIETLERLSDSGMARNDPARVAARAAVKKARGET